jgi:DNA-binding IclR family transcriptional regulator
VTATIGEVPRDDEAATTIKSVERAARVLALFTTTEPRLTLNDIVERLNISKATTHRYAVALRRVNLLSYDRMSAAYTVGPLVLTLAAAARAALPVFTLSGPLMERLVREVHETVVLSVWGGESPTVIRVDDSTDRVIRISVALGARLDVMSAQGRVFCAHLPADQVPGLGQFLARSPQLADELEAVRRNGVAVNSPEGSGIRTVAAPIFSDGAITAVMAVVGTPETLPLEPDSPKAVALRHAAAEMSRLLGE